MKYVWKDGAWRDSEGNVMEVSPSNEVCCPNIQSDTPAYFSVVSNKWIEGKRARRDDLARTGCRPLEPDEGPKYVTSKKAAESKWARKMGLEWNNAPGAGRPKHWSKDFSSKRIDNG